MLKQIYKKLDVEGRMLAAIGIIVFLFGAYRFGIVFPLLFSIMGGLAAAFFAAMIFGIFVGVYSIFRNIFTKLKSK